MFMELYTTCNRALCNRIYHSGMKFEKVQISKGILYIAKDKLREVLLKKKISKMLILCTH